MLTKDHKITFTFFDIGGGDAIWIRFLGTDKNWHNVLLDGGYGYAYKMAFGPLIKNLLAEGEKIDLWIITHIDRDHIGSVLGFVQDKKIKNKPESVNEFWFNHTGQSVKTPNGKLAVDDGIEFRQFLTDNDLLTKVAITTSLPRMDLFGLNIKVLSPTPEKLATAASLWKKEENSGKTGRSKESADHSKKIEELKDLDFHCDTDAVNGSSIALSITYDSVNALLLGDSHPDIITASIKSLGHKEGNPLPVDFMQLSHHGSKANTSPDLLALVSTDRYLITGNGIHNRHPDKEALVRLLINPKRSTKAMQLHFPCDTPDLRNIFSSDQDPFERYNFTCMYRGSTIGTRFNYLPLND